MGFTYILSISIIIVDYSRKTKMLPKFPHFKKLELEDRAVVESIAQHFPDYSEFNFSCMFVWDVSDPVYVCTLNNNLVIKFVDFRASSYYYSLIGNEMMDSTVMQLIEHSKQEGLEAALYTVPGVVVESIEHPEDFVISEDRDNHDYILSVADLVNFRTNKYRGKKNLLNRFHRNYGDVVEYRTLDLTDKSTHDEIRNVLQNWESAIPKDSVDLIVEFAAIERSLAHSDKLGIRAYGSYVGNTLQAFTMFEIVDSKTALIHFDKANKDYIGIFEHLKHNLAKHLDENHGVEAINYAQDMGIPGLREAKTSYHPIGYLKKYTIRMKKEPGA